jgi:hypothetical protein
VATTGDSIVCPLCALEVVLVAHMGKLVLCGHQGPDEDDCVRSYTDPKAPNPPGSIERIPREALLQMLEGLADLLEKENVTGHEAVLKHRLRKLLVGPPGPPYMRGGLT